MVSRNLTLVSLSVLSRLSRDSPHVTTTLSLIPIPRNVSYLYRPSSNLWFQAHHGERGRVSNET